MAIIDGRTVIGSGVLHFRGYATAEAGSAPAFQFRATTEGQLDSNSARMEGNTFTVLFNLAPASTFTGYYDYTVLGTTYIMLFVVQRFPDHSDGPVYEARYTVALK